MNELEIGIRGGHCQRPLTCCAVNMFATLWQPGPDGPSQDKHFGLQPHQREAIAQLG